MKTIFEVPSNFNFFDNNLGHSNEIWILKHNYDLAPPQPSSQNTSPKIEFPSDVTLQFEEGAGFSNSSSTEVILESNKTQIIAKSVTIFDNVDKINFSINASNWWDIEEVSPIWFGAKSDGTTDDTEPLKKAIDLLKLTKQKTLSGGNYKVTDTVEVSGIDNFTINNDLSLIGDFDKYLLIISGSKANTGFEQLDVTAYKGESYIETTTTIASNYKKGDIIKIVSNQVFCSSGSEDIKQGEMHTVKDVVGSFIYLDSILNDTYVVNNSSSKEASVIKINPISIISKGKIYLENNNPKGTGLRINYGANFQINNLLGKNNNEIFVEMFHCFAVDINVNSYNTFDSGQGYGIAIEGSCMYCNITGIAMGARHAVAFGGSSYTGEEGVAWDCKISVIGSAVLDTHIFDTHYSVGRVYWDNCLGIGTITNLDLVPPSAKEYDQNIKYSIGDIVFEDHTKTEYFMSKTSDNLEPLTNQNFWNGPIMISQAKFEEYKAGTKYNLNDLVIYNGWIYKSKKDNNISKSLFNSEWWEGIRKTQAPLFGFRGGENHILNCEGRDLASLINIATNACVSVYCKNLKGVNISTNGLNIAGAGYNIKDLDIDGISIDNSGLLTGGYSGYLINIVDSNGEIKKWSFKNLSSKNLSLGYININSDKPSSIELENLKVDINNEATINTFTLNIIEDIEEIRVNNYSSLGGGGIFPIRIDSFVGKTIEFLKLNRLSFKDSITGDIFFNAGALNPISNLNSVLITNSSFISNNITESVRLDNFVLDKLMISNLNIQGNYSRFIFEKIKKLMYNSINFGGDIYNLNAKPDLVVLDGTFDKPRSIEGYGVPIVSVPVGCTYINLDATNQQPVLYVREPTGWVAK